MSKSKNKVKKNLEIPQVILLTAKILQAISSKLTVLFAAKLFTTPIKHKIPKREYSKGNCTIPLWKQY